MTDYLQAAAAWDRTGEIPAYDRMAYASAGPPPWADKTWAVQPFKTPAPPPEEKPGVSKAVIAWAIGAVVAVLLCGGIVSIVAASGGDQSPESSFTTMPTRGAAESPAAASAPAEYKLGKTFRSGDFEYTVHKVKTGVAKVGNEYVSATAQGAYTRLDVTIKNVGGKPMYFDTDLRVKVEDAKGRQFSADAQANSYGNDSAKGWFTEINPGNSIRAFAFFDLPKGTAADRVVVSAGLFSFEPDAVVPLS